MQAIISIVEQLNNVHTAFILQQNKFAVTKIKFENLEKNNLTLQI